MNKFDARSVLTMMAAEVDRYLKISEGENWSCSRAVPRVDGTMYLDLNDGENDQRLDWITPGDFRWSHNKGKDPEPLNGRLKTFLRDLLSEPRYSLLHFDNRQLLTLRFDDHVVDTMLSGKFVPGQTRWFSYVFQDVFQPSIERFHLNFSGPWSPLVLEISANPVKSIGELVFSSDLYNISIIEDHRSQRQRSMLPHQVERFVAFCMARSVNASMSLEISGIAGNKTPGTHDDAEPISTTRWGNPKQWYQFFSDFEIERSSLCSVQFTDPVAYVVHGEMECKSIEPYTFSPLVSYSSSPWPRGVVEHPRGSKSFFTGIDEKDAVFGASEKLERVLVEATQDRELCMVCVNNTCLPKIIGDDVSSVVNKVQTKAIMPIVTMNTDLHSPYETYQDMVEQAKKSIKKGHDHKIQKHGIALVGFPPGRGRSELLRDLESYGVEVNVCLVPEFGIGDILDYSQSKSALVFPHAPWEKLAKQVLSSLDVRIERIPSPYGLGGFEQLILRAAKACEIDEKNFSEQLQARLGPAMEEWTKWQKLANEYRLGFVIDMEQIDRLLRPNKFYGASIINLLQEMGFGIDVLIKTDPVAIETDDRIERLYQLSNKIQIQHFSTKEQLEDLLSSTEIHAIYSEVFYDSRLLKAGKARFDLSMFEMGIKGALRSQKTLVRLCNWPFYRRYAKVFHAGEDN